MRKKKKKLENYKKNNEEVRSDLKEYDISERV